MPYSYPINPFANIQIRIPCREIYLATARTNALGWKIYSSLTLALPYMFT